MGHPLWYLIHLPRKLGSFLGYSDNNEGVSSECHLFFAKVRNERSGSFLAAWVWKVEAWGKARAQSGP